MQKFFTSAVAPKDVKVSDIPPRASDKYTKNSFSSVSYGYFRSPHHPIQITNPYLKESLDK